MTLGRRLPCSSAALPTPRPRDRATTSEPAVLPAAAHPAETAAVQATACTVAPAAWRALGTTSERADLVAAAFVLAAALRATAGRTERSAPLTVARPSAPAAAVVGPTEHAAAPAAARNNDRAARQAAAGPKEPAAVTAGTAAAPRKTFSQPPHVSLELPLVLPVLHRWPALTGIREREKWENDPLAGMFPWVPWQFMDVPLSLLRRRLAAGLELHLHVLCIVPDPALRCRMHRSSVLLQDFYGTRAKSGDGRTTPKGTGRSGKDLERINKGMDKKLAIHISEGKKRPEVPLQAAKLATEGGIVLRRHIPVLPHWKMYRDEREREHLVNYINKVSVQFSMDTTSKPVISAYADMMKCGQRQMRYKLKKKFFNNIPANDVVVKSPVPSMNDDQWEAPVNCGQAHSTRMPSDFKRDKFDEEPTPVELFREFHSSQKTGSISETVQKAIDNMEEIMEESVQREEPPSPGCAVREVVQASTFFEVAGLQPKKRNRGSVSSRLEALMAELQREKTESRQVEQIVEQQRREIDALQKQAQDVRDSNRILDAQLEDLRNETARKATLMASLISKFQGEGQVHPSSLTSE
ncbi:hypothetical protein EJB05_44293, partial [Eragrostis curvula]